MANQTKVPVSHTMVNAPDSESQSRYGKGNERPRRKGVILDIIERVQSEKGVFYQQDYTGIFPPATVQSVFAILKNWGAIRRVERGAYVQAAVAHEAENRKLREEMERLRAENAQLKKACGLQAV